jgi:hypothetical protein
MQSERPKGRGEKGNKKREREKRRKELQIADFKIQSAN